MAFSRPTGIEILFSNVAGGLLVPMLDRQGSADSVSYISVIDPSVWALGTLTAELPLVKNDIY
jgi:hypothetical protein